MTKNQDKLKALEGLNDILNVSDNTPVSTPDVQEVEIETTSEQANEPELLSVIEVDTVKQVGIADLINSLFTESAGVPVVIVRQAWAGRKKPASQAFTGLRRGLRDAGFAIDEDASERVEGGRLTVGVYTDGARAVRVQYGAGPNYSHIVTAE